MYIQAHTSQKLVPVSTFTYNSTLPTTARAACRNEGRVLISVEPDDRDQAIVNPLDASDVEFPEGRNDSDNEDNEVNQGSRVAKE
jgi:hypothetical protein